MLAILKYWQAILAAIITAILAYMIHDADVLFLEKKQAAELAEQANTLRAQCKADQKITAEVSNDYETKLSNLNSQLATVKRLHPSRCILPSTGATGGHDDGTSGGQSGKPDAVDTGTLYDFAGKAEQYRIQLSGCQDFIRKVWTANGQ